MINKTGRTFSLLSLSVLAATLLLASPVLADTVSLNLSDPVQTGTAGSTLSFFATASAPATNAGIEFLNGDTFNPPSPLSLNDSGFFFGFPLSLVPGESFTGLLFTISLPPTTPPGVYSASFTILGGPDTGALASLSSVVYQVNVPETSAVPEPESLMLFATGLPGFALLLQRRRHLFAGKP